MRKFVIVATTILVAMGLTGCDRHHQRKEAAVHIVQAPAPGCNCNEASDQPRSKETLARLTPTRKSHHQTTKHHTANYSYSQGHSYNTTQRGHYPPPPPPPHRFHERSYDGLHGAHAQRRTHAWVDGYGKRHLVTAGYSRATHNAVSASVNSRDANTPWAHYDEDCDR